MLQYLLKLMCGLGFLGLVTLDPDVPGEELTNQEMLAAYGVLLLMVIIPAIVQKVCGWGWFSQPTSHKHWRGDH